MRELIAAIPDVDALLAFEPEELGATMLFLARRSYNADMFHPEGMAGQL